MLLLLVRRSGGEGQLPQALLLPMVQLPDPLALLLPPLLLPAPTKWLEWPEPLRVLLAWGTDKGPVGLQSSDLWQETA